ncbi:MAG TPA: glycosyl hydrolase family 28-related protein [Chthonomonas sp.]|uniref:glycosyl hydrolase family 28-related protein n=1 Tax=Chthonomonas sp. TaxID=2282153 RepID=UPI002B4ABB3A|nr:glycosyl hydrolase family 28-related protein [Chthonomonas sp.]HLI47531.1 glycosyl hydrolase family 28-related protein [Chthonomonas sp.]
MAAAITLAACATPSPMHTLLAGLTHPVRAEPASLQSPSWIVFEAEQAELMGGAHIDNKDMGYHGTGYVDGLDASNVGQCRVIFAVNVPADGRYPVSIRYANGNQAACTLTEYVNGLPLRQVSFAPTGQWTNWETKRQSIPMRAGLNTFWLEVDKGDSGGIHLDAISVQGADNASRGASLPYVEYEAEDGQTNGTIIGPGRDYGTYAAESSGRRAVLLAKSSQYVQIRLVKPANAIDIRYAIPNSASGTGMSASISLYINGHKDREVLLTSKYAWVYGAFPWSKNPADGNPHHFYDEVHVLLGRELPAGTLIRLQRDSGDKAPWYLIDLIDMEQVPKPYSRPADYVSVTQFGAVPNSGKDAATAFIKAISTAESEGKGVWIPPGNYNIVSKRIPISGKVVIRGAGPWYSVLTGPNAGFEGEGGSFQFYDFAIMGTTNRRDDSAPDNGFDDDLGKNSIIQNVWIEHKKCGLWINWPTDHLYVVGVRVRDTMADGINFAGGTSHSMVEQSELRNTGDDGLAIWSSLYKTKLPSEDNTFRFNTVQLPWLANNIAVYGGINSIVSDNVLSDTMGFGGGINISTNFPMYPFAGSVVVERNTLNRTGGYEYNGKEPFGGIWISAIKQDINAHIVIREDMVNDSTYQGFEIRGPFRVSHLTVDGLAIHGAGTYGIEIRDHATGTAEFSHVTVEGAKLGGLNQSSAPDFHIQRGRGNRGW